MPHNIHCPLIADISNFPSCVTKSNIQFYKLFIFSSIHYIFPMLAVTSIQNEPCGILTVNLCGSANDHWSVVVMSQANCFSLCVPPETLSVGEGGCSMWEGIWFFLCKIILLGGYALWCAFVQERTHMKFRINLISLKMSIVNLISWW